MGNNALSEVGRLTRVLVKPPQHAFVSEATIAAQWKMLGYTAPPLLSSAIDEYQTFIGILGGTGATVDVLPSDGRTTLDSIYARDASIVCARGVILCRMGKRLRADEPAVQKTVFRELGIAIAGEITEPGTLEGGDVVWLDDRTVAVGRGYRTNEEGVLQLRSLLGDTIDELLVVPLPH